MKLIYGFLCANLTVAVVHIGYTILIFYRHNLWMRAFNREDEKGMDRYSANKNPCWIGLNRSYITTLCAIYGSWLLTGWRLGEIIRFW